MKNFLIVITLQLVLCFYVWADENTVVDDYKKDCEARGMSWSNNWCNPSISMEPKLAKTITITECKAISGLTCRLTLLPSSKLPSRIFVQSQDIDGNSIGKEFRLIYPDLEANGWSSGIATFMGDMSYAVRLQLRGEWSKEYDSAY